MTNILASMKKLFGRTAHTRFIAVASAFICLIAVANFNEGMREMNLIDGAILFQVPKGAGGATIAAVPVVIRSGSPCSFIADASAVMLLHDLPSSDQRHSFD
jgi:hypothetical protein